MTALSSESVGDREPRRPGVAAAPRRASADDSHRRAGNY
ncbi:hypothetical protein C487_13642 [Natrinema pallidum DSM 3751]|uniref:Uncharacterized protein n=1 Tax=Natrinema pallidum DSM 3751 TaxID=1227495 RepID=L9YQK1_9EURY|nr:hypothetical protein C487_13642 [Natrinema pallidum DSM 3751]